ncbi:MAG: GNAT family N-acetyltransferase, partial [Proteobacteria bacterium]
MQIRNVHLSDSLSIAGLMTQLGYPTSVEEMNERLTRLLPLPNHNSYVADMNGTVAGFIALDVNPYYEKNGYYGRILALVVDDRFRGKKIGQQLIVKSEAWFIERKAGDVLVNSSVKRLDAHRFYENLGYDKTGFRFVKKISLT